MTEAKIEKGTESVQGDWHCEGWQARFLNSKAHARLQQLRLGNVQRNTEEAGNESTAEPQSLSSTSTPSSNSSQLFERPEHELDG